MNANIQHNQNFIITRDGAVTDEFEPSAAYKALQLVAAGMKQFMDNVSLEARMAAFDVLHGTHYRAIRHKLIEQQKRAAFERSIGLVASH